MRRCAIFGIITAIPALLFITALPGCSKKAETPPADVKKAEPPEDKKGGTSGGKKEALEAKLDGTIKGTVIYDGEPPDVEFIAAVKDHKDKEECLAGKEFEKIKQEWIVDKGNKGVANVVVWLQPPAGKYFNLTDADKERKDMVKIDQPHCAFVPHVIAVFPSYYDGTGLKKSGQVFEIVNSAKFPHNTKWTGDPLKNPSGNETLAPGSKKVIDLTPQKAPVKLSCDFHNWMQAYAWVFDHPYNAVTNQKGEFAINNVPTGVEVTVIAWHEGKGNFEEKKMTFKKGDNSLDLKVKK